MKAADIKVGRTYCNRGKGRTRRTVLEIAHGLRVTWYSGNLRPPEPVVRYEQDGKEGRLYLSSFSQWCGREVDAGENSA